MRIRAVGPAAMVVTALLVGACGTSGATTGPTGGTATATPTSAAVVTPSPTPLPACKTGTNAALPTGAALKIGVVTDVGTVDDKNFNEYSAKGAADGAKAAGATALTPLVPKGASEYASLIQQVVDAGANIVVTVGFNLASATIEASCQNPDTWFLGVDQSPICVNPEGHADLTFSCKGDTATLHPRLVSIWYEEDQPGYLVGMIAATISKSGIIGAIGGTSACAPCIRYLQGYTLGAQSVNPNVQVNEKYVVADFSNDAFHNAPLGKTFAKNFLTSFPGTDVMFQVAGETGNGVLEEACAEGIYGIGVDVDQWLSLKADTTPTYQCIVTSAEKHLQKTVASEIGKIVGGTSAAGNILFNATNDGIGYSPEHDNKGLITPDLTTKLQTALDQMKATPALVTCPAAPQCGSLATPAPGGSPSAAPSGSAGASSSP